MTSLEAHDRIAEWLSSEVRPGNAMDGPFHRRKAELYDHLAREVDDQELAERLADVAARARARAVELGGIEADPLPDPPAPTGSDEKSEVDEERRDVRVADPV